MMNEVLNTKVGKEKLTSQGSGGGVGIVLEWHTFVAHGVNVVVLQLIPYVEFAHLHFQMVEKNSTLLKGKQ